MFCLQIINLNRLPMTPSIALGILGIVIGSYFTYKISLNELKNIEKNKIKNSRKRLIIILTAIIATVIGGIFLLFYLPLPKPPSIWYLPVTMIYPLPATMWATRAIVYFRWQKKMNRKLYWENNKLISIPNYKG
jgi:xanthosine utilization system XapX-like protein